MFFEIPCCSLIDLSLVTNVSSHFGNDTTFSFTFRRLGLKNKSEICQSKMNKIYLSQHTVSELYAYIYAHAHTHLCKFSLKHQLLHTSSYILTDEEIMQIHTSIHVKKISYFLFFSFYQGHFCTKTILSHHSDTDHLTTWAKCTRISWYVFTIYFFLHLIVSVDINSGLINKFEKFTDQQNCNFLFVK